MKRVIFYLITFLIAGSYLGSLYYGLGLHEGLTLGNTVTFSLSSIIGVFVGSVSITELSKRFPIGRIGEYLRFLSSILPFKPQDDPSPNATNDSTQGLRRAVELFCIDEVDKVSDFLIEEIEERDFTFVDNRNIRKPHQKEEFGDPIAYLTNTISMDFSRLFLVGDAGMGKSHLMKKLILDWMDQENIDSYVPIFLPAASWKDGIDVKTWIVQTIESLYAVNRSIAANLIEKKDLIVFVDGLDEIEVSGRLFFLDELNKYLAGKKLVVSCRDRDFKDLLKQNRFNPQLVLKLQELNEETKIKIISDKLPQEKSLVKNEDLLSILNSPLLIGLLIKVYSKDLSEEKKQSFLHAGKNEILKFLWEEFMDLRYQEKSTGQFEKTENDYAPDTKVVHFKFSKDELRAYAGNLSRRTEEKYFTIAGFQPADLQTVGEKAIYIFLSRVLIGYFLSVGLGLLLGGPFRFSGMGLLSGFLAAVIFHFFNVIDRKKSQKKRKLGYYGAWPTSNDTINTIIKLGIYLIAFILVLAPYAMLTGLRVEKDMVGAFATTDFNIAIFFTLIFTLIIGTGDAQHNLSFDIRLIEKNNHLKNLKPALRFGLISSIGFGVFIGIGAEIYKVVQPDNDFTHWLIDHCASWDTSPFFFALMVVTPIAFLIGFVIGLNIPKNQKHDEKESAGQFNHNYSLVKTVRNALIFWLLFSVVVAVIWGFGVKIVFNGGWDLFDRGVLCALGGGIFVGLFWGGIDLFKLAILRLIYRLKNEFPFKVSNFLRELEIIGVLRRQGALFSFRHETLADYLRTDKEKIQTKTLSYKPYIFAITLFVLILGILEISNRNKYFWGSEGLGYRFELMDSTVSRLNDQTLVFNSSGPYEFQTKGKISVGRIAGFVSPLGTEAGFLGMPIGNTYDKKGDFRHGAILYSSPTNMDTSCLFYDKKPSFFESYRLSNNYRDTVIFASKDTITFLINDKEPENNSKEFTITIRNVSPEHQ